MLGLMLEAISLRSLSTLWFWIAMAVFWLHALRHVMGLPFGMVVAARQGGAALARLEQAALVQAQYRLAIWARWQLGIVALTAFAFVVLAVLGFAYGVELALALWFFLAPYTVLFGLHLAMARQVVAEKGQGAALLQLIFYFNIYAQFVVMASILITFFFSFVHLAGQGFFG